MLGPCWLFLCFEIGHDHVGQLRAFEACWDRAGHFHTLKQVETMLVDYVPLRHIGCFRALKHIGATLDDYVPLRHIGAMLAVFML